MQKIYHLSTCDTCKRIIKELEPPNTFVFQDIKQGHINVKQLEALKALSGSYQALFSKRARLYNERALKEQALSEENYKSLILEHYTFLKRPVVVNSGQIFIGNSKKVVAQAKASFQNK
jgi:arsenate reductase